MDWGSAKPFSIGWYTHVQDDTFRNGRWLKRGAIIRYAEWYGCEKPNVGLHMTAEEVARGIVSRETIGGRRTKIHYGVLDPAAFAVISGLDFLFGFLHAPVRRRRAFTPRSLESLHQRPELRFAFGR